jgi:putative Mg2+ transporter-C (MgtC) family protein
MNLSAFFNIDPLDWRSVLTAIVCGVIIGLERQLRGKPVGIRTSSLIVLGTYVFVQMSVATQTEMTDPSRIIGQVVTGIGFLGAGVMLTRQGIVFGVTSAATIWSLASIGVVLSMADHWVAVKLSIVVVLILWGVDFLEETFAALTRGVHHKIKVYRDMDGDPRL